MCKMYEIFSKGLCKMVKLGPALWPSRLSCCTQCMHSRLAPIPVPAAIQVIQVLQTCFIKERKSYIECLALSFCLVSSAIWGVKQQVKGISLSLLLHLLNKQIFLKDALETQFLQNMCCHEYFENTSPPSHLKSFSLSLMALQYTYDF